MRYVKPATIARPKYPENIEKWEKATGDYTKMAIFFDGELQSAPRVNEAIYGGKAQISGGDSGFAYDEAERMVNLLNAGALPVPAKIVEENTTSTLLKNPEHPYTKKLLLASGLLQEQDMDQAMKPL